MTLFYMQDIIRRADRTDYNWKMSLMFGEAASYIKEYDRIEDMETRGYIHRAMGNLALAYSGLDEADGRRRRPYGARCKYLRTPYTTRNPRTCPGTCTL